MIQLLVKGLEGSLQVREVHHPTGGLRRIAGNGQADLEGVAVQARAFMPCGYVGETVGGLKVKFLVDFHVRKLAV